jgi:hypothetical protein
MYNLAYYMYITYVDSYITCILPHILHILTNIFSTLHMTISIGFLFLINFYIYVCFEKKSKTTTKKLRNLPRSFVSCDILSILAECHAVILLFHLNFGFCTLEAFWCNLIFHLSLCNIP